MNKTIREVIENAEQLCQLGNHQYKNFDVEARKLDVRESRILEVSKGSDLLKVSRIYHHCNEAWNNDIKKFAEQVLTSKLTSDAEKNKDIKVDYVWRISNRIDAVLCEAMVNRFPELLEYAQRWNAWKINYNKSVQQIWNVTEVYENPKRAKLRLDLFIANYDSQHNTLKDLINELLFMTDGAKAYVFFVGLV
jgi:hypothetical protein